MTLDSQKVRTGTKEIIARTEMTEEEITAKTDMTEEVRVGKGAEMT